MNEQDLELLEQLASAALSEARAERAECDFDADGVRWLESHIERQRASQRGQPSEEEIGRLGAFLGQCILARYGGEWCLSDQGAAVKLPNGATVFPMRRVRKQFREGEAESVRSLYAALAAITRANSV